MKATVSITDKDGNTVSTKDLIVQPTDVFQWANELVGDKEDYEIDLFLFNKNYVVYATTWTSELNAKMQPIFIDEILESVLSGAETGLQVRDIEETDNDAGVLARVNLERVSRAQIVIDWIEHHAADMEVFNSEYDLKRMRGIVARFRNKNDRTKYFYVLKHLQASSVLRQATDWQITGEKFTSLRADSIKVPYDNQVLIVGNDIFAFNPGRLSKMFDFDARALRKAERIGEIIDKTYKLSMPTIMQGFAFMAGQSPSLLKKMLKVEPGLVSHAEVLETIDRMGLKLMTDDADAIILMNAKDIGIFLDIIADNFMESDTTEIQYLVKSKKQLKDDAYETNHNGGRGYYV